MVDPQLIVIEFLYRLGDNLIVAFIVGLLMLGIALAAPARWSWWAAYPAAVLIGLCLTVAFIAMGMRFVYRMGLANVEVHFGPIHLAIAMVLSGIAFAIVRWRRGPLPDGDVPKPDAWYER